MKKLHLFSTLILCFSLHALGHDHNAKEESYTYDPFFLDVMTSQNSNELKLLKLAERNALSKQIKNFSLKNITLLQKENQKMSLWRKGKYPEAPRISSPDINLSELSKVKGKEFDEKFIKTFSEEIDKSIDLSKRGAQENFETDIKDFAEKLYKLQEGRKKEAIKLKN